MNTNTHEKPSEEGLLKIEDIFELKEGELIVYVNKGNEFLGKVLQLGKQPRKRGKSYRYPVKVLDARNKRVWWDAFQCRRLL